MAKKGQSLSVLFVKKKGFASKGLSRVVIEFHLLSLQNGNLCDIPVISHRPGTGSFYQMQLQPVRSPKIVYESASHIPTRILSSLVLGALPVYL
jgi:hypothetical protein